MSCASSNMRVCSKIFRLLAPHSNKFSNNVQASHARCLMVAQATTTSPARRYSTTDKSNYHTQSQQEHSSQSQDQFSGIGEDAEGENQGEETQYEHDIRQRILAASMPYVQEYGWTQKALEAGAQDEGLPPIAHGMFRRGGAELVHYFYRSCNQELVTIMAADVAKAEAEGEKMKVTQFIRVAVETRLRMIFPYIDIWPQAMAIQTLPQNAVESWTNTSCLVDDIWYYAGDRSTDFNWYTKRGSLFAVYKASEIFMLQDTSPDKENTWTFLDRRLRDLQKLGSAKKSCEQSSDVLKEAVKGFSIMGRNLLGYNSRNR